MSTPRRRVLLGRVPDLLPLLALAAAGLARLAPSAWVAARVDLLLAGLVLVTALDIEPRMLAAVAARWRLVLVLSFAPLVVLGLCGWGLSQLVHGPARTGVLALGLSPTEIASVGLIGLIGGAAGIGIAVLACSLTLSAVLGPPLLGLLSTGGTHSADVLPLLGRFALIVIVPLLVGLVARGARPELARHESQLAALSSLLVVALIYASLSDTGGGGLGSAFAVSAAFLAVSAAVAIAALPVLRRAAANRSLALTIGMRDFAVAAALASGAAGAAAAHVAGIYGVLMLVAGAGITGVVRRRARQS